MKYTEKKLQELTKELRLGAMENGEAISDVMAYDIADVVLFEEEGLKEYLATKGISDPVAYIAEYIFC